jgi:hypothetical protein
MLTLSLLLMVLALAFWIASRFGVDTRDVALFLVILEGLVRLGFLLK